MSLTYYFYDFNTKVNFKISEKVKIYFSSYLGDGILAFDIKNTGNHTNSGSEEIEFSFGVKHNKF